MLGTLELAAPVLPVGIDASRLRASSSIVVEVIVGLLVDEAFRTVLPLVAVASEFAVLVTNLLLGSINESKKFLATLIQSINLSPRHTKSTFKNLLVHWLKLEEFILEFVESVLMVGINVCKHLCRCSACNGIFALFLVSGILRINPFLGSLRILAKSSSIAKVFDASLLDLVFDSLPLPVEFTIAESGHSVSI